MEKDKSPTFHTDKAKEIKDNRTNKQDTGKHIGNDQDAAPVVLPNQKKKPLLEIKGHHTEQVKKARSPKPQLKKVESVTEVKPTDPPTPQQPQPTQQQQGQHKGGAVVTHTKNIAEEMEERLKSFLSKTAKTDVKKVVEKPVAITKNIAEEMALGLEKAMKAGVKKGAKEVAKTVSQAPKVVKAIIIKR